MSQKTWGHFIFTTDQFTPIWVKNVSLSSKCTIRATKVWQVLNSHFKWDPTIEWKMEITLFMFYRNMNKCTPAWFTSEDRTFPSSKCFLLLEKISNSLSPHAFVNQRDIYVRQSYSCNSIHPKHFCAKLWNKVLSFISLQISIGKQKSQLPHCRVCQRQSALWK